MHQEMTMDHYIVTVHDTTYDISVDSVGESRFSVTVNGERIDVKLQQKEATTAIVSRPENSHDKAQPNGTNSSTDNSPAPSTSEPSTPAPSNQSAHQMTAPMPGVIAEVRTSGGATVDQGDTLLVLEAMKMKNDLHADHSAVVEAVLVDKGDQVKYGQPLIQFREA
ncbi:acetyl-CoA carboxylase biotin carboxyl carrier protein subunit [Propionibacterium sp. NM47_B9-13]|jgi:biotin carboxyl carrier protein|nr:acetyl-CoA carboxylase biotin carboxyl carrier protein subunit [Cutibacterium modestum]EFS74474.1 Biotin-requiring enzyme [Cutibacterium modestum HL037PA2]EFS93664.1 Biotin-requiring enzyme [Cutibacterium modestum HL044PA1]EFT16358.1 Biotin-requiring enzyme [Cutibacterium modestum HL037PA3]TGY27894.1 acetyl-CoA carboxylase biotin carboxyl carrier protein subunit [Propionibacterium sp. NM47_B9-13]